MADTRPAALSAAAILLLAVAGWTAYSTDLLRTHPAQAATASIATGTALVTRTDVQQQTAVTGTLGYAGNYSVIAPAGSAAGGGATGFASVITWLPAAGAIVTRGEPAYAVGGQPVPLFYGARPAWRDMAPGITPGPDVRQLQRNLAALGYGSGLGLVAGGQFDAATELAVERWQQAAGLPVTGTVRREARPALLLTTTTANRPPGCASSAVIGTASTPRSSADVIATCTWAWSSAPRTGRSSRAVTGTVGGCWLPVGPCWLCEPLDGLCATLLTCVITPGSALPSGSVTMIRFPRRTAGAAVGSRAS